MLGLPGAVSTAAISLPLPVWPVLHLFPSLKSAESFHFTLEGRKKASLPAPLSLSHRCLYGSTL